MASGETVNRLGDMFHRMLVPPLTKAPEQVIMKIAAIVQALVYLAERLAHSSPFDPEASDASHMRSPSLQRACYRGLRTINAPAFPRTSRISYPNISSFQKQQQFKPEIPPLTRHQPVSQIAKQTRENMADDTFKPMVLDFDRQWWREIIIYEIYVQSFQDSNNDGIGDLRGIIQRLDYIKKLGADMIWLTPIYVSPMEDQGYDIANFKEINPMYGTMKDWEDLCAEVHKRGMKMMMDMVFNHTSSQVHTSRMTYHDETDTWLA